MPQSLRFSLLLGLVFGISFFLYESLKNQLEATTLELRTKQLEEERARLYALFGDQAALEFRQQDSYSIAAITLPRLCKP